MNVQFTRVKDSTFLGKGESNHWVVLDTEKRFGGSEAASKPMELVLIALGGCTGIDVETLLQKMRTPVDNFQMEISGERSGEHPRIFTKIHIRYLFWGKDLNSDSIRKAVALSQNKYCSVSAMLKKSANITYDVLINPPI